MVALNESASTESDILYWYQKITEVRNLGGCTDVMDAARSTPRNAEWCWWEAEPLGFQEAARYLVKTHREVYDRLEAL